MRAAEHAAIARNRQHDRDRIGAWEMLGVARRAVAPPAGLDRLGGRAAVRAEAMALMPIEQWLAFRERRQMLACDQATQCDRAQVHDLEGAGGLERGCGIRLDRDRKACRAIDKAEKRDFPP